ncbi:MAG TPA: BON domain-containing protein [Casimicrobiaceae bacterium]|nr:BON domain-containing protein [Casimicrobiaceae bacterium]
MSNKFRSYALAAAFAASPLLSGCVPVIVAAGVGGAALVATDRRSVGAQADDEAIELKVANAVGARYGESVHVNATSYNGVVLLTGEVPDQAVYASIGNIAATTERVRSIHNDLAIGPLTPLSARTNDTFITSKVKARFVEANKFAASHVKVVTERGVVYLMGIVRRQEGNDAARIASTTSGVARVITVFDYLD